MSSFLLTWNPKNDSWPNSSYEISQINQGLDCDIYWSFKSIKMVSVDDRFFLMKLGVEDKGLIGTGIITSQHHDELHWRKEKAAKGITYPRVDLKFDALYDKPVIGKDELEKNFDGYNWCPQSSGMPIPDDIASKLVDLWKKKIHISIPPNKTKKMPEGKLKTTTIKTYERNRKAREECIEIYGSACSVCSFDFEKEYGEMGKGFIHVHHLNQIADIAEEYKVDPKEDLRPVCPNCHAMLHTKRPSHSIEDIKKRMN